MAKETVKSIGMAINLIEKAQDNLEIAKRVLDSAQAHFTPHQIRPLEEIAKDLGAFVADSLLVWLKEEEGK